MVLRTLLRALILLLVTLWVGGILFFPVVAAVSFGNLPDTHTAGTVARLCLRILHGEGLVAGASLLILLSLAGRSRAYGRSVATPLAATAVMLAATALSQFFIMPRMETDRLAVGGAVDAAPPDDPHRVDFNHLHQWSVRVEGVVLAAGLVLIVLLARPPLESSHVH